MKVYDIRFEDGEVVNIGVEEGVPTLLDYTDDEIEEQRALQAMGLETDFAFFFYDALVQRPGGILGMGIDGECKEMMELALEVGADPDYLAGSWLKEVARAGFVDGLEVLSRYHEFSVDAMVVALEWAAFKGDLQSVEWLLDRGIDPNGSADANRGNALSFAVSNMHAATVQALLNAGANPSLEYNYYIRAATRNGDICVVKLLLEAGATPVKTTDSEKDPMRVAHDCGQDEIVRLLTEYGF